MARNWQEFADGPSGTAENAPYVSMSINGEIVINRHVFVAMRQPEAVVLLFDPDTDTIGVKPASPLMPNAFALKPKGNCGHRRLLARPFARKHDIRLDGTVRFQTPAIEDGILVLELRHMVRSARRGWQPGRPRRRQGSR